MLRGLYLIKTRQLFAYGGDVAIVGRSLNSIKAAIGKLESETSRVELEINEESTKVVFLRRKKYAHSQRN